MIVCSRWSVSFQAAVQKNIPIYKGAVKSNIEVRIDENNFLPPNM